MEETTYDNGRKLTRIGPLTEMQLAAMRDWNKSNVVRTCVTVMPNNIEEAVAKVMRDLEAKEVRHG